MEMLAFVFFSSGLNGKLGVQIHRTPMMKSAYSMDKEVPRRKNGRFWKAIFFAPANRPPDYPYEPSLRTSPPAQ